MNKILRISMIAVLALIANVSFAGVSTIDFTKLAVKTVSDENNKENNGYTFTSGDFTFTAKKNKGQTVPTQNTSSKDLRHYAKNTITISGAKMTKMVFTISKAGKRQWAIVTASEGTMTVDVNSGTATWENTNGSSSVTLTVGDKNAYGTAEKTRAGQFNVDKVDITSDGQGGGETPTPPVEETKVENIAAFKALASGTTATLTLKNAQVVYKNVYTTKSGATNTEYYVRDASGAIQFFNTDLELNVNQVINGTVEVTYSPFNELPEATKTANTSAEKLTITDGETAVPTKVTVADLTTNKYLCDLVTVENANIISETSGTYTNQYLTNGTDKVMIYDKFKTKTNITDGEGFDVTGIFVTAKLSGNIIKEFAPISAPVPTGINNITPEAADANAPAYNLAGQKVGKEYKGVVIKAGKKFIQK
ncbi:hypothetical protein KUA50_001660 [Segatella hominis]|uniref:hypothetical protein n=1 Tax=Segatella hominis TaxID=2518605 RepID=UPI001C43B4CE|nr:hypothetical protein [Segatella hominis]WOZ81699.1 hypothetical protein KUA50_001660 [Segatella hominis]